MKYRESLENELEQDLLRTYKIAAKHGYHPKYFMGMLKTRGAVRTADHLLDDETVQSGLFRLHELGLLSISLENTILNPKYDELFLRKHKQAARERLRALGFAPGGWGDLD